MLFCFRRKKETTPHLKRGVRFAPDTLPQRLEAIVNTHLTEEALCVVRTEGTARFNAKAEVILLSFHADRGTDHAFSPNVHRGLTHGTDVRRGFNVTIAEGCNIGHIHRRRPHPTGSRFHVTGVLHTDRQREEVLVNVTHLNALACRVAVSAHTQVVQANVGHHAGVFGNVKTHFTAKLVSLDGAKANITNGAEAQQAVERIQKAHFAVYTIKRGEKRKFPAAPFTTSSLQQEASRKLGFTTAKTMQVVQQLYEGVDLEGEGTQGIVSYIRTDSVRISEEAMTALREYIPERFGPEYLPETPIEYKGRKNAQAAHEAIRPPAVRRPPDQITASLTKEQYNLYKLIYNRFLASQMMPALFETMTMEIAGDGVGLRFYGEHKKFSGFTSVYEEGTDDEIVSSETVLPQMSEGDPVLVSDVESEQHFTQPPSRYTEASLVRALEEKGIGRPSTYAPTITTIISRGYVSREKKRLYPTELGRMVTAMMEEFFAQIVDTEFTAKLEDQLDEVEEGQLGWKDILRAFYPPFEQTLEKAEAQIEKVEVKDEPSDVPCDLCGAMMVYKMGRFGRFLACPNFPDCRNTKPIITYIDAPCPKCGGRLMEKTSKKNRKFYGCEHYPECDFVSWEKPVTDKCPQCGSYMIEKRSRKGEVWHLCANETCRCRVEVSSEEQEEE